MAMGRRSNMTPSDLDILIFDETAEPEALPLSLLEQITNGFSDELEIGRGGFAVVYKGKLKNWDVAVKRLFNTYMYETEFQREIECLMLSKHKNIVRFLGYCADTQGSMIRNMGKLIMADTQQRLLCFEYLPNGSLDGYIKDASDGLDWAQRYKIIKGICEGLYYLHQRKIVHLDLKPSNILLDHNMMPKITDFGLSRCFEEDQTRVIATKVGGTMGYLAPEFTSREITHKFDLYSLGIIITEILTGKKGYQTVETVLETWCNRLDVSRGNAQWEQIRVCADIGIQCSDFDPAKRPVDMKDIIDRLAETDSVHVIPAGGFSELLGVHPFALCFPFNANKSIPCSLQLTNNTNEYVAFKITQDNRGKEIWKYNDCFVRLPLYGIVPPSLHFLPYTVIMTTKWKDKLPQERNTDMILQSTKLGYEHTQLLKSQPDKLFKEAEKLGNAVNKVTVKAVYTQPREMITSLKPVWPGIKIYLTGKGHGRSINSFDTNESRQWVILGGEYGQVQVWSYPTQVSGGYKPGLGQKELHVAHCLLN